MPDNTYAFNCILHGSFEDLLPVGSTSNSSVVEEHSIRSLADILEHFQIDPDLVQHVLVNGLHIDSEEWDTPLPNAATVRLWPRFAGG